MRCVQPALRSTATASIRTSPWAAFVGRSSHRSVHSCATGPFDGARRSSARFPLIGCGWCAASSAEDRRGTRRLRRSIYNRASPRCAHSSAWIEHRATDPGAGVQILLGAFLLLVAGVAEVHQLPDRVILVALDQLIPPIP